MINADKFTPTDKTLIPTGKLQSLSGGLSGPANINTGLKFVTRDNVDAYLKGESRFEGNSSKQKYIERSGPIAAE